MSLHDSGFGGHQPRAYRSMWGGLRSLPPLPPRSMREIALEVAERHELTLAELRSPSHRRHLVQARCEAFRLCRREIGADGAPAYSLPRIGRFFGRHHTTVLHALQKACAT